MKKEDIYWVWLSKIPGLGSIKSRSLLNKIGDVENLFRASKQELISRYETSEKLAENISNLDFKKNLEKYLEYMEKNKIEIVSIQDERYPKKLKQIYDPPVTLYVKGSTGILNEFSIAMVGSRKYSLYGKKIATEIANELSKRKVIVVSGLARGIDTFSHMGCIKEKEKTIAVLGNGLDRIYPSENQKLAEEILYYGGSIVSEYLIGEKPEKMHFPARNRIISGISDGILVVEAGLKSGSMITVDYGLEQGKTIFAIPGNIDSNEAIGTNQLIKEGAKMVTSYKDILEEY